MALAFGPSEVTLAVEDDGKGFDPSTVVTRGEGGYGLLGIRERAAVMKGTFSLQTAPGAGTKVLVTVPL